MLKACGHSDIGLRRPTNEDAFLVSLRYKFFAIADGIGGHNAGEVASSLAIYLLHDYVKNVLHPQKRASVTGKILIYHLEDVLKKVNEGILRKSRSSQEFAGMGTTLCCLYIYEDYAIYAHIGDSRIYRFRNNDVTQLTEDHSQIIRTKDDKLRQVITRAVGCQPTVAPDISSASINVGDIFLLCSDGMSILSNNDIIHVLQKNISLKNKTHELIKLAKKRGSVDNVTAVLVEINKI